MDALDAGAAAAPKVTAPCKTKTLASKAGITLPPVAARKLLRLAGKRVSPGASVYLAAVAEYLAAEILELSGNAARDNKSKTLKARHVVLAVRGDEELNQAFGGSISSGGVVPHIDSRLLPKKKIRAPKTAKC